MEKTEKYMGTNLDIQKEESREQESKEKVKEETMNLKEETRRKGWEYMAHSKSTAADVMGDFADALKNAAGELDYKNKTTSADYVRLASRGIRQFANSVRERDINKLMDQAKNFGQQRPGLFLGGAVITGFALTHFFKSASSDYEREQTEEGITPYSQHYRVPDDVESSSG